MVERNMYRPVPFLKDLRNETVTGAPDEAIQKIEDILWNLHFADFRSMARSVQD